MQPEQVRTETVRDKDAGGATVELPRRALIWGAAGLAILAGGCAGGGIDPDTIEYHNQPSADSKSLIYKVSGSANRAQVTYTTKSFGIEQRTVKLPWRKEVAANPDAYAGMTVAAQNRGTSGSVTCEMLHNGKRIARNKSSGAFAVVSCTAS